MDGEEEDVDIVAVASTVADSYNPHNEQEISCLSSGQILSCDYTVHPQWLADSVQWPVGQHAFPQQSSQDEMEHVQEEVVIEEPAPIDFDLLISGHDIPIAPEEEEVESYVEYDSSRERTTSMSSSGSLNPRSLLKPSVQLNARPQRKFRRTLLVNRSLLKPMQPPADCRSLLKPNDVVIPTPLVETIMKQANRAQASQASVPIRQPPANDRVVAAPANSIRVRLNASPANAKSVPPPKMRIDPQPIAEAKPRPLTQPIARIEAPKSADLRPAATIRPKAIVADRPKFRQTMRVPNVQVFQSKRMQQLSKQLHMRTSGSHSTQSKPNSLTGKRGGKSGGKTGGKSGGKTGGKTGGASKRTKKFVSLHGENITINHDAEGGHSMQRAPVALLPLPPPPIGQRRQRRLSDSTDSSEACDEDDIQVDIDSDGADGQTDFRALLTGNANASDHFYCKRIESQPQPAKTVSPDHRLTAARSLDDIPADLRDALTTLRTPEAEIDIDPEHISAIEQHFMREFFEGRPTKTPERFLKIRNYIVRAWNEARPAYVSKTAVRQGLRHCGDVNCISRIHTLLEQLGAINFGCAQLQFVRPLRDLGELLLAPRGRNAPAEPLAAVLTERRQRKAPAVLYAGDSPRRRSLEVNYTVSHDDGRILLPAAGDSSSDEDGHSRRAKARPKHQRSAVVRPEFQLIECARFNRRERRAPFGVSIKMSTLMCLQLHSLSADDEVMGFLGGHRDERRPAGNEPPLTLRLERYKPCDTSMQSRTACEMCPISQIAQSESLRTEGYDMLGWFHSHPAFAPDPSRTDVATQANMQLQFAFDQNRPFVGFILSCVDMNFKCVYVLPEDVLNVNERTVPFELDVEIVRDCSDFSREIADVFNVIKDNCDDYSLVLKKFTATAKSFLLRYGYDKDVLRGLNDITL